ncbi:MAG: hypothetical protein Q9184_006306 [Pyrenodesmia sp. 2 TL-2023]
MHTYRYNFSNEGVIATHKNVLAYILCISVVDHRDVTDDEMIYLTSEFAGDDEKEYGAYLHSLITTWKALKANEMDIPSTLQHVKGDINGVLAKT